MKTSFYKNLDSNISTVTPRTSIKKIIQVIKTFDNNLDLNTLNSTIIRDLAILEFVTLKENQFHLTKLGRKVNLDNYEIEFLKQAYKIPKIKTATDFIEKQKGRVTSNTLLNSIPDILESSLTESSKVIYAGYILQWSRFIIQKSTLHNTVYKK
jgi:hypothetical protein